MADKEDDGGGLSPTQKEYGARRKYNAQQRGSGHLALVKQMRPA